MAVVDSGHKYVKRDTVNAATYTYVCVWQVYRTHARKCAHTHTVLSSHLPSSCHFQCSGSGGVFQSDQLGHKALHLAAVKPRVRI